MANTENKGPPGNYYSEASNARDKLLGKCAVQAHSLPSEVADPIHDHLMFQFAGDLEKGEDY